MMTEEQFVDFKCPHCADVVTFPLDSAGRAQECPGCSESVIVPKDGSGIGGKLPIPITTRQLVLRRFEARDWRDLLEFLSDEELFLYVEGRPLGEEEILRWLEADQAVRLTTPQQPFCLGIELPADNKLVGYLSLSFIDPPRLQAAVNLFIHRSFQRKGLATEALTALLDFCFNGIGLHRVLTSIDSRNAAADRLCQKAGLRREGEFLKDRFLDGQWANTRYYAMLTEDHCARQQPR